VSADVVVVGAGPAGLSAAIELRRLGLGSVLVADREAEAGGVPRHCFHSGYGLRDLRRVMTGPAYARTLAGTAVAAGAELRLGTTVTCVDGARAVTMTSSRGIETVPARAVLLATGCRERPRAARLVPGDRPAGVMTTGELQQRVYLGHERLTGQALVVGARLAGLAPAGWPGSTPRVGRSASSPAEGPSGRRWHPGSLSKASSAARPARIRLHPEP
jgi:NADPH-dependent 2,4-dienoyl-CoA reductase/sulfur reductase-like enzyme